MKKYLALLLSLMLVVSLFAACNKTNDNDADINEEETQSAPVSDDGGETNDNNDVTTSSYNLEGKWEAILTLNDLTDGALFLKEDEEESTEAETETETEEGEASAADISNDLANNTLVTYTLTFTGDKYTMSVNADEFNTAVDALTDIYLYHLEQDAKLEGMTLEEYLKGNDTTEADFRADVKASMGSPNESGTWSLDGTSLILGEVEYIFMEDGSDAFTIAVDNIYFSFYKAA